MSAEQQPSAVKTGTVEIRSRWDAARVLYATEIDDSVPSGLRMRAALERATQARQDLGDANLRGANLADAYLADAKGLKGPVPADPPEPYVYKPNRSHQERAERFRKRHPDVPIVKDLDAKILAAIESGEGSLEMDQWHTCETTHCRAGWAIVLAGEEGRKLERKVGPHRAGMLIYGCSTGHVPYFFAKNEEALADIRACAARSQAAQNASATTTEPAQ